MCHCMWCLQLTAAVMGCKTLTVQCNVETIHCSCGIVMTHGCKRVTVVVLHLCSNLSWGMHTYHHLLPSTSPFSTWNALALSRSLKGVAVRKLLLHSKCLWCGFEDRDACPVYDLRIRGFPLGYPPQTAAPHFHQLTTLRVVIPMKNLLVHRQSPVSH